MSNVKRIKSKHVKELLKELNDIRSHYPSVPEFRKSKMQDYIDSLVSLGEYPTTQTLLMNKNSFSILDMVEYYGVKWYKWEGRKSCPFCKSDLRDLVNGPPFKREIGVYDTYADRTVHFICPDCKKIIQRREK